MKNLKRILSLILCFISIFSINSQNIQAAGGSSSSKATKISIGKSDTDTLTAGGSHWYKFKTSNGGGYNIYSTGSSDIKATLYKKNFLGKLTKVSSDDNSGTDLNFKIKSSLSSTTTYYIKVYSSKSSCNREYSIHVKQNIDSTKSASGGSWKPKQGSPDPDGQFVTINKLVYLDKNAAAGYYVMVDNDNFKKTRDKIISMSTSAATAYLGTKYKFLSGAAIGYIMGEAVNWITPNLTDLEKKAILENGNATKNSDGTYTFKNGIVITSMTTYASTISGGTLPITSNTYSSWTSTYMKGAEGYRGTFSKTDKTPTWK